jgi:hypothetical protein
MAVKNLQTVTSFVANNRGVVVIGMECKGSMRFGLQASQPLPRLPRLGCYPSPTDPDAATAQAVKRAGRSASGVGEHSCARLCESWQRG